MGSIKPGTTEQVLDALEKLDGLVRRMWAANDAHGVLEVLRGYLRTWPAARVRALQAVDGGWSPFDAQQRVAEIAGADEVQRIGEQLSAQCAALREAGLAPSPELLEIDLMFFFAAEKLQTHCGRIAAPARYNGNTFTAHLVAQ